MSKTNCSESGDEGANLTALLCAFGLHRWVYVKGVELDGLSIELGIYKENPKRRCTKCRKVQEQDVHCLGVNPTRYVKTWMNT